MNFPNGIPVHKTKIMVHCLATKVHWEFDSDAKGAVKEVRQWHVHERGWNDIAYAAIVDRLGHTAPGRDLDNDGDVWDETGAGAKGHNRDTIHIALTGGHGSAATDSPYDHYSSEQLAALRSLIEQIQTTAGRNLRVMGHNEVSAKACPGFNVPNWYKQSPHRGLAQSKTLQAAGGGITATVVGGLSAVGQLDGTAQLAMIAVVAVVIIAFVIIFRERLKKWSRGIQ